MYPHYGPPDYSPDESAWRGRLEAEMDDTRRRVGAIEGKMDQIISMLSSRKTDWSLIWSAAGVVVALGVAMSSVLGLIMSQGDERLRDKAETQGKILMEVRQDARDEIADKISTTRDYANMLFHEVNGKYDALADRLNANSAEDRALLERIARLQGALDTAMRLPGGP